MLPDTRYARSGDLRIAYQVVGEGPLDLVFVPGFISNVDLAWDDPVLAGDGFLATFDGPARAVRCGQAIVEAVKILGLEVRGGLHTGEIEIMTDDDIGGIAVHIASRVLGLAGANEVLVTGTVRDLVAGSSLAFADRGHHALKGLPEQMRLFCRMA